MNACRLVTCGACGQTQAFSPNGAPAMCDACRRDLTREAPCEALPLFQPAPAPMPGQLAL